MIGKIRKICGEYGSTSNETLTLDMASQLVNILIRVESKETLSNKREWDE